MAKSVIDIVGDGVLMHPRLPSGRLPIPVLDRCRARLVRPRRDQSPADLPANNVVAAPSAWPRVHPRPQLANRSAAAIAHTLVVVVVATAHP